MSTGSPVWGDDSLPVVASGSGDDGARWAVRAGGTADDFMTALFIELPNGERAGGGGHGGPVLEPGRRMSISVHRGPGVQYIVGRVDARVTRLHLELAGSGSPALDIAPEGHFPDLDVRFVAAALPPVVDLVSVTALDGDGQPVEDVNTARYRDWLTRGT
jgi:hypothetical protein